MGNFSAAFAAVQRQLKVFMAHRCGFTLQVLADTLQACGFPRTAGIARPEAFDLWVVASKAALSDVEIRALAVLHLPWRA
jgi:hypothetical protein